MKTYDLYGLSCRNLEEAKARVEPALGVTLIAHESGYHCGDYYRYKDVGEEHFILQRNFDDLEGEWTEPANQDQPLLLYVNETDRSAELRDALEQVDGVVRLRHQDL